MGILTYYKVSLLQKNVLEGWCSLVFPENLQKEMYHSQGTSHGKRFSSVPLAELMPNKGLQLFSLLPTDFWPVLTMARSRSTFQKSLLYPERIPFEHVPLSLKIFAAPMYSPACRTKESMCWGGLWGWGGLTSITWRTHWVTNSQAPSLTHWLESPGRNERNCIFNMCPGHSHYHWSVGVINLSL